MVAFPTKAIAQPQYKYEEYIELRGYETLTQKGAQKQIYNPCSCVSLAKSLTGFAQSIGRARNWPTNSTIPAVGSVVILNESPNGHVAYITKVWADEFEIDETNYIPCTRSSRVIKNNNKDILGYYVSS